MKINIKVKYQEGFLPTPRCRKLRYRDAEEIIEFNLEKTNKQNTPIAFKVENSTWNDKGIFSKEIIEYKMFNNNLYVIVKASEKISGAKGDYTKEQYISSLNYDSDSWRDKEYNIKKITRNIKNHLIIDGILYKMTNEPMYVVMTFGLGNNHGGTSLSISSFYNENISKSSYYNALNRENAIKDAVKTATNRRDNQSINDIKNCNNIEVLIKSAVKTNPQSEHKQNKIIEYKNSINSLKTEINSLEVKLAKLLGD